MALAFVKEVPGQKVEATVWQVDEQGLLSRLVPACKNPCTLLAICQINVFYLLCVRPCAKPWGCRVNKTDNFSALVDLK